MGRIDKALQITLLVCNWIDWLIRGYTKTKRDRQNEEIKADPRAALAAKFKRLPTESESVPSGETKPDVDRNP